jgi:cytochrome c oxidase subunit II
MRKDGAGVIDTREEFDSLFSLYLPIAIAVAGLVTLAIVVALVRSRRGRPSQREGFPLLEGLYALLLAGVVVLLVTNTFRTEARVDRVSDHPDTRIQVTAFQWGWRFTYPGEGVSVVGNNVRQATLVVPARTTIRFELISRDVIHSFWIPELRFKRDAFPERETRFDLVFSKRGMVGKCAEFCGLHHADMGFNVLALPRAEFRSWLAGQREPKGSR